MCFSTLTTIELPDSYPHLKSVSGLTFQLPSPTGVFWTVASQLPLCVSMAKRVERSEVRATDQSKTQAIHVSLMHSETRQ